MIMKFLFSMVLSFMPGIINLFWLPKGIESEWYTNLDKFPFTPAIFGFGFMWAVIHIFLGIGLFIIIKGHEETDNKNKAVGLFLTNIILSSVWPFVLFQYHIIIGSTIIAFALVTMAYFMQKSFAQESKLAGNIVWVYILWLIFSLYLNIGLLILN
ncbi:MAG: tryptophan-rich sensory protein [Alphaproteobacteria bacterium]|nr:tryptophan-rich sensory protein [Alphaproteobacteria bacterium]MBN2675008.1 tryptophan-rich sensory protein [Alphaproteobacteria bacterium]